MHSQNVTVIITASEVNNKHGTGIYLKRIFNDDSDIISIRSSSDYGGEQTFGYQSFRFNHHNETSPQLLLQKLGNVTVRRILCIPYTADDVRTALELKNHYQAPLCTYLMDDQNIFADGISDDLMQLLLQASELRLAISAEMRDFYGTKFNSQLTFIPPLIDPQLCQPNALNPELAGNKYFKDQIGVLIGNIWGKQAFRELFQTVGKTQQEVHWYGQGNVEALIRFSYGIDFRKVKNIKLFGFLPTEEELISKLRQYPFAIVATGKLDLEDDRPEISQLSFPSRIPFILATSQTPIIVLGNPRTAAARFITRFNLGRVCAYESRELEETILEICQPEVQAELRQNALSLSSAFDVSGFETWLWNSLAAQRPLPSPYDVFLDDNHFEELAPSLFIYAQTNINQGLNLDEVILDTPTLKLLRWIWLWTALKIKVKTRQLWRLLTLQKPKA